MNPVEHFFAGWAVANVFPLERRDRMLVTLAGVIPDLDGFGILPELLTRGTKHELLWWTDYHHLLGHNLGFALFCTAGTIFVARRRILTPLLVALSFHLHLLCDVIGARGPDGYQWPIPYLLPFSNAWQWTWSGAVDAECLAECRDHDRVAAVRRLGRREAGTDAGGAVLHARRCGGGGGIARAIGRDRQFVMTSD